MALEFRVLAFKFFPFKLTSFKFEDTPYNGERFDIGSWVTVSQK
jgi:hypothetical protein